MRVLDEDFFKSWEYRYDHHRFETIRQGSINLTVSQPKNLQSMLQEELESELFLIGATALEDKLQDGVPEAIEEFH